MTQGEMPGGESIAPALQGRLDAASASLASDPRRAALHTLADETRRLINGLVATGAPQEVIEPAIEDVRRAADRFDGFGRGSLYGWGEVANAGAEPGAMFDHSPLIGKANPLAPPMILEVRDDRVLGTVTFGAAYEGPPGHVHGGYVAAMFDELLGAGQTLAGTAGMTGTLTVRYRKPTPLHTELHVTAWLDRVEGRKIFVNASCEAGGQQVSEAQGIFVSLQAEHFERLREERDRRDGTPQVSGD